MKEKSIVLLILPLFVVFSSFAYLAHSPSPALADDYQVLNRVAEMEQPVQTAKEGEEDKYPCGKFAVATLEFMPSVLSTMRSPEPIPAGKVAVLGEDASPIAEKTLAAGEGSRLRVGVSSLEDASTEGVEVFLLSLADEKARQVVASGKTDSRGIVWLDRELAPGSYQVALECGNKLLAAIPPVLGAGGLTALGIALLDDDSSGGGGGASLFPDNPGGPTEPGGSVGGVGGGGIGGAGGGNGVIQPLGNPPPPGPQNPPSL